MAVDMFLKVESVTGESMDKAHKGEIDISSWAWGASNSGDMHRGGGGGAGKVSVNSLVLEKDVEKSSPVLLQACCSGKTFPEAVLTVRKSGGDKPIEFLVITLVDVLVTSLNLDAGESNDTVKERLELSFAKYNMVYKPQKQDGTEDSPLEAGWDVLENVTFA